MILQILNQTEHSYIGHLLLTLAFLMMFISITHKRKNK